MDISMFFVFPGLLITIGVVLLITSIIIIFIAYKSEANIKVDASLIKPYKDKNSGINISKRKISTNKHVFDSNLVEEQPAMREPENKPKKETTRIEVEPKGIRDKLEEQKEESLDIFEEEFKNETVKKEESKKETKSSEEDDIELL